MSATITQYTVLSVALEQCELRGHSRGVLWCAVRSIEVGQCGVNADIKALKHTNHDAIDPWFVRGLGPPMHKGLPVSAYGSTVVLEEFVDLVQDLSRAAEALVLNPRACANGGALDKRFGSWLSRRTLLCAHVAGILDIDFYAVGTSLDVALDGRDSPPILGTSALTFEEAFAIRAARKALAR